MKHALLALLFVAAFSVIYAAEDDAKLLERISTIRSEAESKRFDGHEKVDRDFRTAVAGTFQFADRVDVFLLDYSIGKDLAYKPKVGDETFPIRPYQKETKILKKREVPTKEIQQWCVAVTKTITSEKKFSGGALCHMPIHGLRIYARNELLFETSICWHCRNYYFETDWQSLTEDAADLRKLLEAHMPVPEEEKARFPGNRSKAK